MVEFLLKTEWNDNSAYLFSNLFYCEWIICACLIIISIFKLSLIFQRQIPETSIHFLHIKLTRFLQSTVCSHSDSTPSIHFLLFLIIPFARVHCNMEEKICRYFRFFVTWMKILITGVDLRWLKASMMRFPAVLYACLIYDTLCAHSWFTWFLARSWSRSSFKQ